MSSCALVVFLALAAPARADVGAYVDGHWHYPGQRPANNAMLSGLVSWSTTFWNDRHVTPCVNPTLWLADDLGGKAIARADAKTCELWVTVREVQWAQSHDWLSHLAGQDDLCGKVLYEVGHLGGLPHLPKGVNGVMALGGDEQDSVDAWPVGRRIHAHGTGACGRKAAAEFNAAQRRARTARTRRR